MIILHCPEPSISLSSLLRKLQPDINALFTLDFQDFPIALVINKCLRTDKIHLIPNERTDQESNPCLRCEKTAPSTD